MDLQQTVSNVIKRYNLLEAGDSVIVGLSGGPDSVALLYVLCRLRDELSLNEIRAVHLHHGLREHTADRDERFVTDLCEAWGIPLAVYHADVAQEAKQHGESVEQAGRRLRYDVFNKEAVKTGKAKIATAHHRTDLVETVLMNMTRGCGPAGLSGIPLRRECIIRPLLYCTAQEVRDFCAVHELPYVIDETNEETVYVRNRIRHDVLPTLCAINPAAVEHIATASELVREEHEYVCGLALRAWDEAKTDDGIYAVSALRAMDPILFSNGLQNILRTYGGFAEYHHLRTLQDTLSTSPAAVTVCGDVTVKTDAQTLQIVPNRRSKQSLYSETPIYPPCDVTFGGKVYRVHRLTQKEFKSLKKIHKILFNFCVSYDMILQGAVLRNRQDGDAFRPVKRGCTKSLKKWCNEEKLSLEKRDELPILCDEHGILAILGYAVDERAAVTDQTETIAWFEIL